MKLTIEIKDKEYPFFLELIKKLDFIQIHQEEELEIPEEHKDLIRKRRETAKKDDFVKWVDVKKDFEL